MKKRRKKSKKKKITESVSGYVRIDPGGQPVKVRSYKRTLKKGTLKTSKKKYVAKYLKEYRRDTGTGRFA